MPQPRGLFAKDALFLSMDDHAFFLRSLFFKLTSMLSMRFLRPPQKHALARNVAPLAAMVTYGARKVALLGCHGNVR